ncbi:MAG: glycosyltransferase, partial [Nocardioides sp.]
ERLAWEEFLPLGVRVLANERTKGLSGARNTGCGAARGDVVAFLDDDAAAMPGWLAAHTRHYADPRVMGVGGQVTAAWESGRPGWFPGEFDWVVGCSYVGLPRSTAEIRNPIGANMSFRRDLVLAVGGFSEALGRVGTRPAGCEETELSIHAARLVPWGRVVHDPAAVVHHHVPDVRSRWPYFRRRCWSEGRSKAVVRSLSDPRAGLSTERRYVRRALPAGLGHHLATAVREGEGAAALRASAILAGLTITTAGYLSGLISLPRARAHESEDSMSPTDEPARWLHYDVHGRLGVRVEKSSPAAAQLRAMLACFASDRPVPADVVVSRDFDVVEPVAELEHELRYTTDAVEMVHEKVQVTRSGASYGVHGEGELLTALVPVLDRAMVERGAAMFHAATVGYHGYGVALPAAGGTGKTSTVAKLMQRPGFSFMGDDWAFLSDDGQLLGYEKPMFIKPHHRPIYPHLFEGVRKPMVPVALSRPVGRLTTVVHPAIIRYPRLADVVRRWSPEHRMVTASRALPGVPVSTVAPLLLCVYVERYSGDDVRLVEVGDDWMVDRLLGNFHIEMAGFSQRLVTAMGAACMLTWRQIVDDKADVLRKALDGVPCHLLQVPGRWSPDEASDAVVRELDAMLPALLVERPAEAP